MSQPPPSTSSPPPPKDCRTGRRCCPPVPRLRRSRAPFNHLAAKRAAVDAVEQVELRWRNLRTDPLPAGEGVALGSRRVVDAAGAQMQLLSGAGSGAL